MTPTTTAWFRRQLRYRHPWFAPIGVLLVVVGIASLAFGALSDNSDRLFPGLILLFIGWSYAARIRTSVVDDALVLPYRWQYWRARVVPASEIDAGVVAPPEGPNVMPAVRLRDGEIIDVSIDRTKFERMMNDLGVPVEDWKAS